MELPPSMQYQTLFKTTQHLESRNHQSNDWQTNRLIPRPGRILLHWVFLRLRIQIEEGSFFAFSFLVLSSAFVLEKVLACTFVGLVRAKSLPSDKPFLPFFPFDHQTGSSSCHHSGSCTCSSSKNALPVLVDRPLPFPFPFSLSLFLFFSSLGAP